MLFQVLPDLERASIDPLPPSGPMLDVLAGPVPLLRPLPSGKGYHLSSFVVTSRLPHAY